MLTSIKFLISSDQATVGDAIGSQLEPTPVDVQPAVARINDRTATFDGTGILISLTDGQDERTTRHSLEAQI